MSATILQGDALTVLKTLASESVQCVITSPPYWGLRDYGVDGQLGLEPTPEEFVEKMVVIFREVRRVLRTDGTCWVNLGDTYSGGTNDSSSSRRDRAEVNVLNRRPPLKLKPKNLLGIPWRVALALQADGWYLRSDIIWAKPNPMPESVRDRPTKAHEYIFLLTKSGKYFYDQDAVRQPTIPDPRDDQWGKTETTSRTDHKYDLQRGTMQKSPKGFVRMSNPAGKSIRTVWSIPTQARPEAHFAAYPDELVRRCVAAGTSEKGCCSECGAPWVRITSKNESAHDGKTETAYDAKSTAGRLAKLRQSAREKGGEYQAESITTGWSASCKCEAGVTPCTVLDPFAGRGTTLDVAIRMGRKAVGIELNEKYIEELIKPLLEQARTAKLAESRGQTVAQMEGGQLTIDDAIERPDR